MSALTITKTIVNQVFHQGHSDGELFDGMLRTLAHTLSPLSRHLHLANNETMHWRKWEDSSRYASLYCLISLVGQGNGKKTFIQVVNFPIFTEKKKEKEIITIYKTHKVANSMKNL
jgi:hypothetical protein